MAPFVFWASGDPREGADDEYTSLFLHNAAPRAHAITGITHAADTTRQIFRTRHLDRSGPDHGHLRRLLRRPVVHEYAKRNLRCARGRARDLAAGIPRTLQHGAFADAAHVR